ncbi:Aldo/keto reductase family protein [Quadrisphaera sp. DSM 44207]|nr:aldo/keto reductase [Quadrisphaera sp. DSM 44207]SDQ32909.1 Aldo/keto reductase family protein [Quadrisphaera sp. DSM 44207]
MGFRRLGSSGLKVSEITYGNWLTHGSQVEDDTATRCVHAALDVGISTFDTADVDADGRAESVLGAALAGERRESLEILTNVYWPTGPGGRNDTGLSREHVVESIDASLRRVDEALGDVVERDPARTAQDAPQRRPA